MAATVIDPAIGGKVESLKQRFLSAQPFRHVVIDGFFAAEFCSRLMADFPPFEKRYAVNERGESGGKAVISNLGGVSPAYARFDAVMKDAEFLSLLGRITDIPGL